ncbi:ribose-phosphate diphosphokinase, partial [Nocardiopsis lucentensis]|uniref:ribose-phosphate diphosphokinase n=1 Tax=Nocardiopsis lucentensis TaxID=53441 RepID=UPI000364AE75
MGEHLVELLLLLDACRRGGARTSTAVVPYFGYARQDRRGRAGEAVGSRVVADTLASAGADRLVVVDPHTVALEAMCAMPVEMLTSVPVLADALAEETPDTAVVVAPDLGAVKLAEHHAGRLGLPVAVVRKRRLSGETVQAGEVAGEIVGRPAVVVDDMISTGGTIEAAVDVLLAHGALADVTV